MFDIGFLELLIIAVVGLLVIGPDQLPQTLRSIGLWVGRFKRGLQQTRSEFEQQIGADDIRRQLHNEEVMQRLNASKEDINRVVNRESASIEASLNDLEQAQKESQSLNDAQEETQEASKDETKK
jgi:sec-independent protein translocase protein TatB